MQACGQGLSRGGSTVLPPAVRPVLVEAPIEKMRANGVLGTTRRALDPIASEGVVPYYPLRAERPTLANVPLEFRCTSNASRRLNASAAKS